MLADKRSTELAGLAGFSSKRLIELADKKLTELAGKQNSASDVLWS